MTRVLVIAWSVALVAALMTPRRWRRFRSGVWFAGWLTLLASTIRMMTLEASRGDRGLHFVAAFSLLAAACYLLAWCGAYYAMTAYRTVRRLWRMR